MSNEHSWTNLLCSKVSFSMLLRCKISTSHVENRNPPHSPYLTMSQLSNSLLKHYLLNQTNFHKQREIQSLPLLDKCTLAFVGISISETRLIYSAEPMPAQDVHTANIIPKCSRVASSGARDLSATCARLRAFLA